MSDNMAAGGNFDERNGSGIFLWYPDNELFEWK